MASDTPTAEPAKPAVKTDDRYWALYNRMLTKAPPSETGEHNGLTTEEVCRLGIYEDTSDTMKALQRLSDNYLVRYLKSGNGKVLLCAVRSRNVAEKMRALDTEQLMVFGAVEESGALGAWQKHIKMKTSIAPAGISKTLKHLEGRGLIKQITNIKNPTQKSYILATINPGQDVAGGPWHGDGELDLELVGVAAEFIMRHVVEKSWAKKIIKTRVKAEARSVSPIDISEGHPNGKDMKRKRDDGGDIEDLGRKRNKKSDHDHVIIQVPHDQDYAGYATVESSLEALQGAGMLHNIDMIKQEHVKEIMNLLVWEGLVEEMFSGYRSKRGVLHASEALKNTAAMRDAGDDAEAPGLVQTPCGKCPVFDLCEEGGPINPQNCAYFEEYLSSKEDRS